MGVYEARGQLAKSYKDLMMRWNEAKLSWNDVRAEEFEKKYLEQFEMDMRMAAGAMDQMAVLLSTIRNECS